MPTSWPVPHPHSRRQVLTVLRGLGVLLVLFGVVAMHQLAGGTHTATMTMPAQAHAATVTGTANHLTPAGGDQVAATTMRSMSSMPGPPGLRTPTAYRSTAQHGPMPHCLSVLPGPATLALPVAAPAARVTPPRPPAATRRDSRPPGRGPPRDLLAQFCVLRT